MSQVDRRQFLTSTIVIGSLALVGCTSSPTKPTAATPTLLRLTFPDGFRQQATVAAGIEQRLAFVLSDDIANLIDNAPESVALRIRDDADAVIVEELLPRHQDGIITPYYPFVTRFDRPGTYQVSLVDFPDVPAVDFLVVDPTEIVFPQVGEPLPAIATPTTADPMGIEQLCTRAIQCPFHDDDLATALENAKPTVLLVATPGFCQTDICGPVVDLLIEQAEDRDDLNVIHLEVWNNPSAFSTGAFPDVVPAVGELGLPFEPALFVADSQGIVLSRLDATFDRAELAEALAKIS